MGGIVLFKDKNDCCACGACENICPKRAISMKRDEYGCLYPKIDENICIKCGACKQVCAFQGENKSSIPCKTFAAVNRNQSQLMGSSSGGVFSAVASKFLQEGGVVFGATLTFENGHANPHHIAVETLEDLPKLQGSKYVQSNIDFCYQEAQEFLNRGRKVLFSGTPCQVAGLYGYLCRPYKNLTTMDVICHGVPNAKFFDEYIQMEKTRRRAKKITGYIFRDKKNGWGMSGRIYLINKKGISKSEVVPAKLSSYYTLFLNGCTYRENCYSCKYANEARVSDLTIGDYWGIEKEHPELLAKDNYNQKLGISCILVNTEVGQQLCDSMGGLLCFAESVLEKIQHRNGQLIRPSSRPLDREKVLELYKTGGYSAVEKWFQNKFRTQIIIHTIYNKIPYSLRIKLKKIMKG